MTNIADWEGGVGRNWAAQWRRTDATFAQLTPRLLNAIAAEPGRRVVDIGCGAGEVSLAVARARPQAQVIGVDVSPDLVDAARGRAGALPNLSFELADASSWTSPQGAPDLYVSRHGVMFFPDPPAAFAHLASVAAPDARLVFTCFRAAKENAWPTGIANLLPPAEVPSLPFPPGPFAFADPEHVRRCLKGWRDLAFTPVDFAYVAGEGEHAVAEAMALFQRIGPSAFALRTLPEAERATFEKRLLEFVEAHHQGGQVTFPAAAWLITATSDHDDG